MSVLSGPSSRPATQMLLCTPCCYLPVRPARRMDHPLNFYFELLLMKMRMNHVKRLLREVRKGVSWSD